ncbi:MAG: PAS domain S-box protein [Candidatus Lokiarchaeota archaeon]
MIKDQKDIKNSDIILKKFIETFKDLIFIVSYEGTFLDFYGDLNLLYVPPENFLNRKITEVMPSELTEIIMRALKRTINITNLKNVESSLKNVKSEYNKRLKLETQQSQEIYMSFINTFNGIAYQGYRDFSGSFFHGAVKEITGYSEEDFLSGKIKWDQIIYPEDKERIFQEVNNFHKSSKLINVKEYRITTKSGKIKWVWSRYQRFYDNDRKTEGTRGIIIDITEKKEIELKYQLLFNHSPYAILLIRLDGSIIDCNKSFEELYRLKKEEVLGENIFQLPVFQKNKKILSKRFKALINGSEFLPLELKITQNGNKEIWLEIKSILVKQGNKNLIQTTFDNITQRKVAEQEIIRLNNMKSQLLSRSSHELKTPLVSIKGFADLFLELYGSQLNSEALSIINEIKSGCQRLEFIIQNIIDTSKLESGAFQLHKSLTDLSEVIRRNVKEIRGLAKFRKISIDCYIHNTLVIKFEEEKIHEVIGNLLTNALKFTAPNGKLTIKTELKENFIIVSIQDTGLGFTEDEKTQLFQQFGKIERYGKGYNILSDGAGFGLYISKKIIELHGGTIWVESEGRNKGSTFYFTLPFDENSN